MILESFEEQRIHGIYAADVLRDAENMMTRIAQWDLLSADEREREFRKGTASRFFEVPGFQPRMCHNCNYEQWFDYREDPEGACMVCGAWDGQKEVDAA